MNFYSRKNRTKKRLIAFGVIAIALGWQANAIAQDDSAPHLRTASVINKFQTVTMNADYFETRVGDFIKELSVATDTNFILDESAKDNNLDEEALLTLKLKNVRISTLLDEALGPFDCTWHVKDGIVRILSVDSELDQLQIRSFDCSDLLAKIKPIQTTRTYRRSEVPSDAEHGRRGGQAGKLGGGRFSVQEELKAADQKPEAASAIAKPQEPKQPQVITETEIITTSPAEQLHNLIQETLDPESWEQNGGNGRLRFVNGIAVIAQTNSNLRAIDNFLDSLRESGLMN